MQPDVRGNVRGNVRLYGKSLRGDRASGSPYPDAKRLRAGRAAASAHPSRAPLLATAYHVHGALSWRGRVRIEVDIDSTKTNERDANERDD